MREARRIILQYLPMRSLRLGAKALGHDDPFAHIRPTLREQFRAIISNDRKAFPSDEVWQLLEFVPDVAGELTGQILQAEGVLEKIEDCPTAAFYVMTKRNTDTRWFMMLAERLQASFESDGELVAAYLTWIKHRSPPGLSFAEYRKTLWRHPLHAIRWAMKENDRTMGAELLEWAHDNAHVEAGAAWLLAVSQESEDPERWRPIIQKSALYMAASAASLGMKYTVPEMPQSMDGRSLFMLLRNRACENVKEVEALLREVDPFWYLEWILTNFDSTNALPPNIGSESLNRLQIAKHPLLDTIMGAWTTLVEQLQKKPGTDEEELVYVDDVEGEGAFTNPSRG